MVGLGGGVDGSEAGLGERFDAHVAAGDGPVDVRPLHQNLVGRDTAEHRPTGSRWPARSSRSSTGLCDGEIRCLAQAPGA
jgi:hypothetical protein